MRCRRDTCGTATTKESDFRGYPKLLWHVQFFSLLSFFAIFSPFPSAKFRLAATSVELELLDERHEGGWGRILRYDQDSLRWGVGSRRFSRGNGGGARFRRLQDRRWCAAPPRQLYERAVLMPPLLLEPLPLGPESTWMLAVCGSCRFPTECSAGIGRLRPLGKLGTRIEQLAFLLLRGRSRAEAGALRRC